MDTMLHHLPLSFTCLFLPSPGLTLFPSLIRRSESALMKRLRELTESRELAMATKVALLRRLRSLPMLKPMTSSDKARRFNEVRPVSIYIRRRVDHSE